jgi:hypothetical protein
LSPDGLERNLLHNVLSQGRVTRQVTSRPIQRIQFSQQALTEILFGVWSIGCAHDVQYTIYTVNCKLRHPIVLSYY